MNEIRDVPAVDYHHDRVADVPTLSASIASILCSRSPLHAWYAHPKLNPDFELEHDEKFAIGTVAHQLLLEPHRELVEIVEAPDWRSKAAKEARAEIVDAGKVALLPDQAWRVALLVDSVRAQLREFPIDPPLFEEGGEAERTLVWEEDHGVVCRARPDWLSPGGYAIDDLKTTTASARPDQYERSLVNFGADIQAVLQLRGLRRIMTSAADWTPTAYRWVVVETQPPFAMTVISPKPTLIELGERKVEYALARWRDCLEAGVWPGYERRLWWADAPPWEIERWLGVEAELEEDAS